MKWRPALLGCALVAVAAPEIQAQTVVRIVGNDVKHAAQDFAAIWTSRPRRPT